MEPGAVSRIVVLEVAQMDRAGGLPHGMNGQIPPPAGPEKVYPQLRRVLHRVFGPSGGVALPRRHEHVPHTDVVDHVPTGGGQAVPALIFHIRLHPVEPPGRDGKFYAPPQVRLHPALRPGAYTLPAGLQSDTGFDRDRTGIHLFKRQRQLKGLPDPPAAAGQGDGRPSVPVLLKDLPGDGAPLNGYTKIHVFPPRWSSAPSPQDRAQL